MPWLGEGWFYVDVPYGISVLLMSLVIIIIFIICLPSIHIYLYNFNFFFKYWDSKFLIPEFYLEILPYLEKTAEIKSKIGNYTIGFWELGVKREIYHVYAA